ncbi:N-acetylgalactosamine 6-sulfate sulfatase (GALNS) [Lentisphaera araneosa HTCC2155]|uniref:N-acetylgalactosamine 6-sulfate sulfatase (GALNS) n=1 Tax=Lentisphaera araneosa HTCC2155 TaxID=313628 RepID=A6DHI0_9BACT|nr:arylsulfatase [Lentisphaera araneosa]EDM29063.1 N-acetylgalactosamine 6-sulfate sulfatase (GALNS) [Lentisphaera araneosa HTCC2155]
MKYISVFVFLMFAANSADKPNIIFIMCDDMGYGQLGSYGQKMIKTPRLDQMAKEGLRLTDYYAGTAVCAPSRCSLMTGQHVGHTYIRGNKEYPTGQEPIPAETITVAEKMKEAGYATALIGKWGLGYPGSEGEPNKQGFDYFFGYNDQKHAHNHFPKFLLRNEETLTLKNNSGKEIEYSQYMLTDEAKGFIKKNKDNPFFLYLAYVIPHSRLQIPGDDECYLQYKDESWPEKQKKHAGMISRLDKDVGSILDLLKEMNLAENTLVVFTSDNGAHREGGARPEFFNDSGPLSGIKRSMYEGGVRVPFIAHWPGVIKPGQVSNHIGAHWDLMPTACELGGVQPPEGIDGISYVPLLKGNMEEQEKHDYLYFELHWPTKRGVRKGDWVALQSKTSAIDPNKDTIKLFNLKNDLGQKKDLATQYPEKVEEFKKIFLEAHTPAPLFEFGQAKPKRNKKGKK